MRMVPIMPRAVAVGSVLMFIKVRSKLDYTIISNGRSRTQTCAAARTGGGVLRSRSQRATWRGCKDGGIHARLKDRAKNTTRISNKNVMLHQGSGGSTTAAAHVPGMPQDKRAAKGKGQQISFGSAWVESSYGIQRVN